MPNIQKKKDVYPVSENLKKYLDRHGRIEKLPIYYNDLKRYDNFVPIYNSQGDDTLWISVFYSQYDMSNIHYALKMVYAILRADGDMTVMEHLYVDRVDLCTYGNTQPFRIRIVNRINDNFDYFYIKYADASRLYGLELEHILSPNRISYLVDRNTLIEEHIAGIPGEQFFKEQLKGEKQNLTRLAKEFVKFNERCFIRLLGDMHSSNFVIDVTPDFDEIHYRIRAIDFDQQSYEGRKSVYMPQYFKQNNPLIEIGLSIMTPATVRQYQKEEQALIATRVKTSRSQIVDLLDTMSYDEIAPRENILQLREDLAQHYHNRGFLRCERMGDLVRASISFALT